MIQELNKSIVFITGTFIGNNCWEEWICYFESRGYTCLAPAWPHKKDLPEQLRNNHPDAGIASNNLGSVTSYFEKIISALPERPVLIGHSVGGLIVQLLLQRGIGSAGVAVHSFAPYGINNFKLSFLKAWWEMIGIFSSASESYMISFRKWKHLIANGMDCQQQKDSYYKYAIPESKLVIRNIYRCKPGVNYKKPHAPLLFISGTLDRLIPASLNYANYKKYKPGDSITDYREIQGRNHLVFEERSWREETTFILYWLQNLQ